MSAAYLAAFWQPCFMQLDLGTLETLVFLVEKLHIWVKNVLFGGKIVLSVNFANILEPQEIILKLPAKYTSSISNLCTFQREHFKPNQQVFTPTPKTCNTNQSIL